MKFKQLLLFLSFVFLSTGISQNNDIKFNNFTINEGLSQSFVTDVLQDNKGYIWVATQDGLNKFDGYKFIKFEHNQKLDYSLPNNYVHDMFLDDEGFIWLATERGLSRLNPKTEHIENFTPKHKSYSITKIINVDGGFIALSNNGIVKFKTKSKEVREIYISEEILDLQKIKNEIFFTTSKGLFQISSGDAKRIESGDFNKLLKYGSNFLVNKNGSLYNLTSKGTKGLFNQKLDSLFGYLNVNNIYLDQEESIQWLATQNNGLVKINTKTNKIQVYKHDIYSHTSLLDNHIQQVFEDRSGVVWVASERGVSNFDKFKQFISNVSINENPLIGLTSNSVWAFAESINGDEIYIGTDDAVSLYYKEKEQFRHFPVQDNNAGINPRVLTISYIDNQRVFVGFKTGFYQLNISENSYSYTKLLDDKSGVGGVYKVIQEEKNLYWVFGTKGLGLFDLSSRTMIKRFLTDGQDKIIGEGVVRAAAVKDGHLYFAVGQRGILVKCKKDVSSKKFDLKVLHQFSSQVNSIAILDNDLWLGTYGRGIVRYNTRTEKRTNYTTEEGLSNNVVYGVIVDQDQDIWASTNRGLVKIDPETDKIKNFTIKDGLQSNEFNSGAYFKSLDNRLYFGGINGYSNFQPEEIRINRILPSTIITDIRLYGQKFQLQGDEKFKQPEYMDKMVLDHEENNITIYFAATHYSDPKRNKFQYILEGLDEEWTLVEGGENWAHYANLPAGEYVFIVKSANADGEWSTYSKELIIIVNPPFYDTWWFKTIVTLLVLLLVYFYFKRRIESIRRQKVRLELQVVERTRELKQKSEKLAEEKLKVDQQKKQIEEQNKLLQKEKSEAVGIIHNILPQEEAAELLGRKNIQARHYKEASVMFTDFVGFTKITEKYEAQTLVQMLNIFFSKFDEIITKRNLEKIKTIGDAYMCVGGVPIRNPENPVDTVLAALEIQAFMNTYNDEAERKGEQKWDLRIGINTGEVVSGVLGLKKFAYDIWGSTVNEAQQMERHGKPGVVNISGNTFDKIEPLFDCEYRGKIKTKKGLLDMYFIVGIKPELSVNGEGIEPNEQFEVIKNYLLRSNIMYSKAERYILKLLKDKLSPSLHYHGLEHTKDVTRAAERIALLEGITDEELFLLKTAANYHDAGFIEQYDANEPIGVKMAQKILPKYGYEQSHIEIIKKLIHATTVPHKPNSHLEEIICDADLDYLGRDDFWEISDKLKKELIEHGKIEGDRQWDELQVKFFNLHKYFTKSAIKLRQEKKDNHLKQIIEKLEKNKYKS
jgi:class 3 adenylate cyclase/ligand-binding sensor domain-containing protein/predicted metal-dependent HD superfamily phosphohydrolase